MMEENEREVMPVLCAFCNSPDTKYLIRRAHAIEGGDVEIGEVYECQACGMQFTFYSLFEDWLASRFGK